MICTSTTHYEGCSCWEDGHNKNLVAFSRENRKLREEVARLKEELAANAAMLARQCDLARVAETEVARLTVELARAKCRYAPVHNCQENDCCPQLADCGVCPPCEARAKGEK